MKLAIALSVLTLSTATTAAACELDALFESSYILHAAASSSTETSAQIALNVAAAQRDRHMELARETFAARFGIGVSPTAQPVMQTVAAQTTEQTSSDADRRTQSEPLYR